MTRQSVALAMFVAASLAGGSASAGSVTITFAGGISAQVSLSSGAAYSGTTAGAFHVTNPVGLPGLAVSDFYTFCVDLEHVFSGSGGATLGSMADWDHSTASAAQKQRASYLGQKFFDTYPASSSDFTITGGYQLAIWELLFETDATDTTFSIAAGRARFKTQSTLAKSLAASLIAESAAHASDGYAGWLITAPVKTGKENQDFMAPTVTVPDPLSSAGALMLGMLALAAARGRATS